MIWLFLTWLAAPFLLLRCAMHRQPLRRILVIQTAKIGDFVATTPVFRSLRTQLPNCEITALLHPVNVPLAKGLSSIDRIISLPPCGYKGWAGKQWLLSLLGGGFDGVLILSPNLANMLVPLWCGIPYRVSVLPDRRQGIARLAWPLLSHGELHHPGQMFRQTALSALQGFGLTSIDRLVPANEAALTTAGRINASELLGSQAHPRLGIGIGAGNRMKALSPTQLAQLIDHLAQLLDVVFVLIGTDADREAAAILVNGHPSLSIIDTTGGVALADLPALLAKLDCFVGVDSGATYLADAVGTPVVDFMGPADASDQRPCGPSALVIRSIEPCAPCSHTFDAPYQCPAGHLNCIRQAPIEQMVEEIVDILVTKMQGAGNSIQHLTQ